MQTIAFFDMDKTLLSESSGILLMRYLLRTGYIHMSLRRIDAERQTTADGSQAYGHRDGLFVLHGHELRDVRDGDGPPVD